MLIPLALEYHATEPFLSNEQYDDVYSRVCDYFIHEQDASTYCSSDQCIEILSLVKRKSCINSYTFINGEDDRVAEVVFRIVERGLLSKHIISDWIKQFSGTTYSNSYPKDDILRTNTKNLLRSICFKLMSQDTDSHKDLTEDLIHVLSEM
ncbi:DUF2785 domain-containing protein [Paenibacillus apis]|uniref:DUF2785 domain-containing protein n=1 Tax=Paenibacillus apis TaxID=1792174 RepID=UPI0035B51346